jgi:hypothetical protein
MAEHSVGIFSVKNPLKSPMSGVNEKSTPREEWLDEDSSISSSKQIDKQMMFPVWRTTAFLSSFRGAYRTVDISKKVVLQDNTDEGHAEIDDESSDIDDSVVGNNEANIWSELDRSVLERRIQQMPISTVPSLTASLKLITDTKTKAAMKRIAPVLTNLDALNNKFVDLVKVSSRERGKDLQRSVEVELTQSIMKSIADLNDGEVVALPGGNQNRYSELFYLVKRESKDKFSFTVFNSTESVQFHAVQSEPGSQPRYCGTLTVNDIPAERMINHAVVFLMVRLKTNDTWDFDDNRVIYQVLICTPHPPTHTHTHAFLRCSF